MEQNLLAMMFFTNDSVLANLTGPGKAAENSCQSFLS